MANFYSNKQISFTLKDAKKFGSTGTVVVIVLALVQFNKLHKSQNNGLLRTPDKSKFKELIELMWEETEDDLVTCLKLVTGELHKFNKDTSSVKEPETTLMVLTAILYVLTRRVGCFAGSSRV